MSLFQEYCSQQNKLRELLARDFKAYRPEHEVGFARVSRGSLINYGRLSPAGKYDFNRTHFEVSLLGDYGFIHSFSIAPSLRGRNLGRSLLGVIETFCLQHGVSTLELVPAKDGVDFWPKMGFTEPASGPYLEKRLG